MPPVQRESFFVPWVTLGGTAVAVTTVAWMSNRFVSFSWFRRSLSTTTATATTTTTATTKPSKSYYLDYNGTTPVYPEVFEAMTPFFTTHFGNPSSGHLFGTQPRKAIALARKQILSGLLGSSSNDLSSIWFTGCGTESDNMAIKLALVSSPSPHQELGRAPTDEVVLSSHKTKHIVTCNVEHPAIENYLKDLETNDEHNNDKSVSVTRVPVDTEGRVSSEDVIAAITPDTVLVTLMLANNESGALQPVKEVAEECRKRGVLCHTDAAVSSSSSTTSIVLKKLQRLCVCVWNNR